MGIEGVQEVTGGGGSRRKQFHAEVRRRGEKALALRVSASLRETISP